jgi:uncharacterized protein (TIGR03000 family)
MAQHHGGGHAGGGFHPSVGHAGGGFHPSVGHAGGGFHPGVGHAGGFHPAAGFHPGGAVVHHGGAVGGAVIHHGGGFATVHHGGGFNGFAVHHGGFYGHRGGGFYGHPYRYGGWGGYGGWGYPYYGWGLGLAYPGYSNYVYSPSYYYGDDTYPYGAPAYDSYPDYSDYSAEPAYGDLMSPPSDAGAYAPPAPAADNVAHMHVVVPPDAKVWFNGSPTQQTGSAREFGSPPLVPGQDYSYDITARWTENGQEVTRTRHVDVRANADITVDFTQPVPGQ